jgi:hypothetical protein
MTAKDALTTTAEQDRVELISRGTTDARVSEALALFQTVSQYAPAPAAHFAPVKYSASGNVAVTV